MLDRKLERIGGPPVNGRVTIRTNFHPDIKIRRSALPSYCVNATCRKHSVVIQKDGTTYRRSASFGHSIITYKEVKKCRH